MLVCSEFSRGFGPTELVFRLNNPRCKLLTQTPCSLQSVKVHNDLLVKDQTSILTVSLATNECPLSCSFVAEILVVVATLLTEQIVLVK